MSINNLQPLSFFPLIERLEEVLGSTVDIMELITLIDKKQYLQLRSEIANVFEVGEIQKFSEKFGDEVEFGDVSDAVRETTFSIYDATTPADKQISHDERVEWLGQILKAMDSSAVFF